MGNDEPLEIKPKGKRPGVSYIEKAEKVDPEFLEKMGIKKKPRK